ncbi:winged helix-turn-helix transcriptional regulator [Orbus wheelerorum]|uniref:winged helix-turn-helix transcriptional regulator n=1 Tax=Orbus wheelerorum TaxID=3074111 RepID=UPI00370D683C
MLRVIDDSLKASITDNLNQKNDGKMSVICRKKNSAIKPNQTAKKILAILRDNSSATIAQLSVQLDVSTRTVERNLKLLQQAGILKRLGSKAKAYYWQVI